MTKRHEIIALLAAAAGLGSGTVAHASVTQHLNPPAVAAASEQDAITDQMLSRMIQLAEARGHDRSGNPNSAGSSSKSPQGNGNAQGSDRSGNPNAAGSPTKPGQGQGQKNGDGNNPS